MTERADEAPRSQVRGTSIALVAGLVAVSFIVSDRRAMLLPILGDDGSAYFATTDGGSGGGVRYLGGGLPRTPSVSFSRPQGDVPPVSGALPGGRPTPFLGEGGPLVDDLPVLSGQLPGLQTAAANPGAGGPFGSGLPGGSAGSGGGGGGAANPVTPGGGTAPGGGTTPGGGGGGGGGTVQPEPPVTQPPVTEPPVTQPPVVQPPVSVVPEPAVWAMMIFGFGAIGLVLRRRSARLPAGTIA